MSSEQGTKAEKEKSGNENVARTWQNKSWEFKDQETSQGRVTKMVYKRRLEISSGEENI